MKVRDITNRIYYLGVNDRRTALFENNWPLPYGVTYNSYLIKDEKNVLVDTIEYGSAGDFFAQIDAILNGEPLHYLVVNHVEPDHSGMIKEVLSKYKGVKIIGNEQTFKLLEKYYNIAREDFQPVADGGELSLGGGSLKFAYIPWVHWPETMVTLDMKEEVLFTCDAFGGFGTLDGGIFDSDYNFEEIFLPEMRRYYSNIVSKWSNMVAKAIAKLSDISIKVIAPSHGLVWRENPKKVINLYNDWAIGKTEEGVVVAYASMYGNTSALADYIGNALSLKGVKNVKTYDVSKTHVSYILSDIQRYKGLILGSCAYNTVMHPMMEHLCNEISIMAPKNRILGLFGTSGWNGAGVKALNKFAEEAKLEVVTPNVEAFGAPCPQKVEAAVKEFAANFIEKLK